MTTINKAFIVQDDFIVDNSIGRQFVIPSGPNSARPGAIGSGTAAPIKGTMRLNDDSEVVEIYNGTSWQSVASSGDAVNAQGAEEIALVQSIIFG